MAIFCEPSLILSLHCSIKALESCVWTFAHFNHTAIRDLSVSACLGVAPWIFLGFICKAMEQEMRLVCSSGAGLEDVDVKKP